MLDYCIVIPFYNHGTELMSSFEKIAMHELPIILVDDGSTKECRKLLDEIAELYDQVTIVEHRVNKGKGAAVLTGLELAKSLGYSHILQIDADGQHDPTKIPLLIETSMNFPQHVICGHPVFDESVPQLRRSARYLTHCCVWLETLSFRIKDSMCGCRVYPVEIVVALALRARIGKRMDFDTEVLVRLDWADVKFQFIPIAVTYPEGVRSNFRLVYDNWLITKMHTRLLLGMFFRLPSLLSRAVESNH